TNGPMLLCQANGKLPGHVFEVGEGKTCDVSLDLSLIAQDRVPAIEIIRNGEVVETIKVDDPADFRKTVTLQFKESGWFLARAITDNKDTFRFASTGPFYVAVGKNDRYIAQKSLLFFLDWADERYERVRAALTDE